MSQLIFLEEANILTSNHGVSLHLLGSYFIYFNNIVVFYCTGLAPVVLTCISPFHVILSYYKWYVLIIQFTKFHCQYIKIQWIFCCCCLHCKVGFFFPFIFISWRLITLQYCSGFCHTLTWISHGFKYVPHPDPPSLLPPHPIPLGLPSAPALRTCLMHPTWARDLFHPW